VGSSLLITLREGLEISLVLAIIAAYLRTSGRADRVADMWVGAFAAAVACVVTGLAFHRLVGEFEGKWEQFIEGVLAFAAVAVLTWMIFWMRGHARGIASELHHRIDAAVDGSRTALVTIAFVAVGREGFETVLFLLGAETSSASGADVVVGGAIGLGLAAALGVLFWLGSEHIDVRKFFNWTGLLLILFAAGLFAKGIHEFREFFELEGAWYSDPVWEVAGGPFAEGTTYDFMKGLFGWSADPERVRVVAYVAFLIPALAFYFRGDRERPTAVAPAAGSMTAV
jgi:high-affinity iron transporter